MELILAIFVAVIIFWVWKKSRIERDADAQFNLGEMCRKGEGVPQNYVYALMWFNIAVSEGYKMAVANIKFTEKKYDPIPNCRSTKTSS